MGNSQPESMLLSRHKDTKAQAHKEKISLCPLCLCDKIIPKNNSQSKAHGQLCELGPQALNRCIPALHELVGVEPIIIASLL